VVVVNVCEVLLSCWRFRFGPSLVEIGVFRMVSTGSFDWQESIILVFDMSTYLDHQPSFRFKPSQVETTNLVFGSNLHRSKQGQTSSCLSKSLFAP
jgi:hypothetical protein